MKTGDPKGTDPNFQIFVGPAANAQGNVAKGLR